MLDKSLAIFVTALALAFVIAVMCAVPGTVGGFLTLMLAGAAATVGVVKVWSRIQ